MNPTDQKDTITPEVPQNPSAPALLVPTKPNNKKLYIVIVVAVVVIALLLGTIVFLLLNKGDAKDNPTTKTTTSSTTSTEAVTTQEVVATNESSKSGLYVDLYQPQRSGNTLVVNYRIYNKDKSGMLWADAPGTGVYQSDTSYAGKISEPYAVSNTTDKKYGLVRDANGQILATKNKYAWLKKGESLSGYVTVALPPSGSTVTISLGDMQVFSNVKITY